MQLGKGWERNPELSAPCPHRFCPTPALSVPTSQDRGWEESAHGTLDTIDTAQNTILAHCQGTQCPMLPPEQMRRGVRTWSLPQLCPSRTQPSPETTTKEPHCVSCFRIQSPCFVSSQYPAVADSFPPFFHLLLWSLEAGLWF